MDKHAIYDWLKSFVFAIVVVFLIQVFCFSSYVVHGQSMMPTIHNADRVIVNKLEYDFSQPERFDIVIFHHTKQKDFIKRVIGLPGDSLHYKKGVLYVNGEAMREPYLKPYKKKIDKGYLTRNFTLKEVTGQSEVPRVRFLSWEIIDGIVMIVAISALFPWKKSSAKWTCVIGRWRTFRC